ANCHVVCLSRDASRRVSDDVHVIAVTHRMYTGHCETHLRPECGDHELLPARPPDCVDNSYVFPSIDERAVDGSLIWKDILNGLEDEAAALFVHGRQDRWNVECLRCCRES